MMAEAKLLLLVVSEGRQQEGIPLFEFIVRRLRQLELAGATAVRAEIGFGHYEALHLGELLEFPADRPIVIFAVDRADRIEHALAEMGPLVDEGLVVVLDAAQRLRD